MLSSLFTGISGLNANSNAMSVISDNIANVNTTAFKSSSVSFANILSQAQSGFAGSEIGNGVSISDIVPQMEQGSVETTNSATDLAIYGDGFFVVKDAEGTDYYTRCGEFKLDENGNLVDGNGYAVQGWDMVAGVGTGGEISDVNIGDATSAPSATTEFSIDMNLDASASDGDQYSTSLTVYDSLGNDIDLTVTMTRNGSDWDWAASIPSSSGSVTSGSGTLTFDSDGVLSNGSDETITLSLSNGATSPHSIAWDLVDAGGSSNGDISGYAATSSTTALNQDGYASGTLQAISIGEDGIITAAYSNGQSGELFQIALASFTSSWGLTNIGGNLYTTSTDSGQPTIGTPDSGTLGGIISESLEMSNVDLATEFVNLITTQRAFQANSRSITASDEILVELMNIKR